MRNSILKCLAMSLLVVAGSSQAREGQTLWSIGQADHGNAEFALAPGGFQKFKQDALFVVGRSDAKVDWPYVQPGPSDAWGGGKPHTFSVLFALKEVVAGGNCSLDIDLLDTQNQAPPRLRIEVNGKPFERQLTAGAGDESVKGNPAKGKPQHFAQSFPAALLKAGNNEIAITTLSGSWLLYDAVKLTAPAGLVRGPVSAGASVRSVESLPALLEKGGQRCQPLNLSVLYYGAAGEITVSLDGREVQRAQLKGGSQQLEILAPEVTKEQESVLALVLEGKTLASEKVVRKPVRPWEVYVLMHSHTDIGYTDIQPNIEKKQAQNVVRALELIRQTRDYPVGARFKWNLEVMWAADQFFRIATPAQLKEFEQAVHDGNIGVDAMYGNLLTGLCRYEEMLRQVSFATGFGRSCGVTVDSMMISDVPGLTWGVVPVLAAHGVKYVSAGPNASRTMEGDRIGYVREKWENNPFYWESPSGTERVLYWGSQGGYSFGHHFSSITVGLPYLLQRLEEQAYPYDTVQLRWTKGDNGPPDEGVMPEVRAWNAKYIYPKLVIATTSEAFHAFEKRYGAKLPTFRGDMTPYWEDGAPSSSRETGINRHSADRLVQAETMWALRQPGKFPTEEFAVAWKNAAIYSEHTWGAYNSISQPDLPFVKTQWKYKQGYALDADKQSRALLDKARGGALVASASVDVYNTVSWTRTELATLPKETKGDAVKDDQGKPVPSQRLSTGELVFLARDIPPFGARRFTISEGAAATSAEARIKGTTLSTSRLSVTLDEKTGDIVSLRRAGQDTEFADGQVNNYLYLPGAEVAKVEHNGPAKVRVLESGPLVVSLVAESEAPGCNHLSREVRLVDGIDRVEIIDLVDKKAVRTVEGVHFGFSFKISDPAVHINSPGAIGEPEKDQLAGACKNWFSVERWVDVSNEKMGVTWATADAPMMELGGLTANLPRSQPNPNAYLKTIKPSARLYSWVMNNHWHTNYRAEQDGPTWFRYALQLHGGYDSAAATRFGVESTEPLIVTAATGKAPIASRLQVQPASIIATALKPGDDGQGLVVRLYNPTAETHNATLTWTPGIKRAVVSNAREDYGSTAPDSIMVPKFGTATVRVQP